MIVNIRGEKISITDAMKNQIESKCDKLNKYFENSKKSVSENVFYFQNRISLFPTRDSFPFFRKTFRLYLLFSPYAIYYIHNREDGR